MVGRSINTIRLVKQNANYVTGSFYIHAFDAKTSDFLYNFAKIPSEFKYAKWPRVISLTVRHLSHLLVITAWQTEMENIPGKRHRDLELVHEDLDSKFDTLLSLVLCTY